jgi:hypothetical protein
VSIEFAMSGWVKKRRSLVALEMSGRLQSNCFGSRRQADLSKSARRNS